MLGCVRPGLMQALAVAPVSLLEAEAIGATLALQEKVRLPPWQGTDWLAAPLSPRMRTRWREEKNQNIIRKQKYLSLLPFGGASPLQPWIVSVSHGSKFVFGHRQTDGTGMRSATALMALATTALPAGCVSRGFDGWFLAQVPEEEAASSGGSGGVAKAAAGKNGKPLALANGKAAVEAPQASTQGVQDATFLSYSFQARKWYRTHGSCRALAYRTQHYYAFAFQPCWNSGPVVVLPSYCNLSCTCSLPPKVAASNLPWPSRSASSGGMACPILPCLLPRVPCPVAPPSPSPGRRWRGRSR
jgi:hypothetical protein